MTLGALIVDTLPDKRAPRWAIERTLAALPVRDCLVVSDTAFVDGARHVPVPPLAGLSGYNAWLLDRVVDHLRCDAYLVVQWDGFVIDGQRWREAFAACDYIGAPWLHRGGTVGGGGFSLRSRRMIEAVRRLRGEGSVTDIDTAEDVQVCVALRAALAAAGMRFAATDVARAFSFERLHAAPDADIVDVPATLGFHGAFNFPLVLPEQAILDMLDAIVPRLPASRAAWHLFLWHAWQRRYHTLGARLLDALGQRDRRLWAQVAQGCLARGLPPAWLRAAA